MAKETLAELQPEVLEERAEFPGGGVDELARRTDIDSETKAAALDRLDAIQLPEGVLESAELAVSILRRAKDVEFAVREALGHVSPVEKPADARAPDEDVPEVVRECGITLSSENKTDPTLSGGALSP